eukprot:6201439-Amphidinium_carterae.1
MLEQAQTALSTLWHCAAPLRLPLMQRVPGLRNNLYELSQIMCGPEQRVAHIPGPLTAQERTRTLRARALCPHPSTRLRRYGAGPHGTFMKCDACGSRWRWWAAGEPPPWVLAPEKKEEQILLRAMEEAQSSHTQFEMVEAMSITEGDDY